MYWVQQILKVLSFCRMLGSSYTGGHHKWSSNTTAWYKTTSSTCFSKERRQRFHLRPPNTWKLPDGTIKGRVSKKLWKGWGCCGCHPESVNAGPSKDRNYCHDCHQTNCSSFTACATKEVRTVCSNTNNHWELFPSTCPQLSRVIAKVNSHHRLLNIMGSVEFLWHDPILNCCWKNVMGFYCIIKCVRFDVSTLCLWSQTPVPWACSSTCLLSPWHFSGEELQYGERDWSWFRLMLSQWNPYQSWCCCTRQDHTQDPTKNMLQSHR